MSYFPRIFLPMANDDSWAHVGHIFRMTFSQTHELVAYTESWMHVSILKGIFAIVGEKSVE